MPPYPEWLRILAWAYLSLSFLCAAIIVLDEFWRPQHMLIMNVVWPITAIYFGPAALWGYYRSGLKLTKQRHHHIQQEAQAELCREGEVCPITPSRLDQSAPTPEQVMVATTHCGAGCALGDIVAEWLVFAMGLTFAGSEFQTRLVLDLLLAWAFGIVFQYLTIAPLRGLSFGKGLLQAVRADTIVIILFEIGLFGWMALTQYVLVPGPHLGPTEPVFWFMMQIGMMLGFFTSYPANIFVLKVGWKERMPQSKYEMKQQMQDRGLGTGAA